VQKRVVNSSAAKWRAFFRTFLRCVRGIMNFVRLVDMKASLIVGFALLVAACGPSGSGGGQTTTGGDTKKNPMIGSPAPDFSGETVNGQGKFSLSANKGKVVLVDFWATWCGPCIKSFPKLQELNVKYKGSLVIIGVSQDEKEKKDGITDFAKANGGAKFPILWDDQNKIIVNWKTANMPTSFIIDKNGVVKFVHQGFSDGEELEIEKEVKSLM
jgi:cytochrome c biogenesis protein CcmG, thiol:disulfide interchange protein DsbE